MALTLIPSDLIEQAARADRRHCSRILHKAFEQSLQVKEVQRTVNGLIAYDAVSPSPPQRAATAHPAQTINPTLSDTRARPVSPFRQNATAGRDRRR